MVCENSGAALRSRVLVAEDNPSNYKLVEVLLRRDYDLVHAVNGAEAVELFRTQGADLVLMDITMPNMDGLQALKKIREGDPNAKVVMCTAMGQESMVVDAIKSGARDFVVKPFDAQRIVKTVNDILGK